MFPSFARNKRRKISKDFWCSQCNIEFVFKY